MSDTPATYFEEQWAASADPWDHAGRWYEQRKYDLTVAALPRSRYRRALEPACGIGLLTCRLSHRADEVLASDRYERAAAGTRARCAERPNVSVGVADIRHGPVGRADLVVIGEVLYYFGVDTVVDILRRWSGACEEGGHVVLVHHRPITPEHVLTGDHVHAIAHGVLGAPVVALRDPSFDLDVFAVH